MLFALSTNWNNRRLHDGAAVADEAIAMGFDALEIGYDTPPEQISGIRSRLDRIPVHSLHAYAPVPLSAPTGHPELYQLCSPDDDMRALARQFLSRSFACAAGLGAKVVVFHAAYVDAHPWWRLPSRRRRIGVPSKGDRRRRAKRGKAMLDVFRREFDLLAPRLEKEGLVLALENLPRFEGFPSVDEAEALMRSMAGAPLALWFDTGHARVRECRTWDVAMADAAARLKPWIVGMHLNDVRDVHDDHFAPGEAKVDFAALRDLAEGDGILHVVEPSSAVTAARLKAGLEHVRQLWREA